MSLVDVGGGGGTKNKAPPERSVLPSGGECPERLDGAHRQHDGRAVRTRKI